MVRRPVLTVKDFGPVREAEIELRPMTVLIGRNNTGKSYLSSLTYAIGRSLSDVILLEGLEERYSRAEAAEIAAHTVKESIEPALVEVFERELKELVRLGSGEAEIQVKGEGISIFITLDTRGLTDIEVSVAEKAVEQKLSSWFIKLTPSALRHPIYLIAERAGVFRLLKPLIRLYIGSRAHWPSEDIAKRMAAESLRLPRLAADMLADTLFAYELWKKHGEKAFKEELRLLEEIMEGTVVLTPDLRLVYKGRGGSMDLGLASSLVAELAPFYLAIKHMSPNRSLIIEEPEAHIHPEGQVMLARLFARLVRKNVPALITTHSDLIPVALAHLTALSGLSPDEREALGYTKNEFLRPEELAIYWLKWNDGTVAEKIEVRPGGVLEHLPEMDDVIEDLYGEEARLLELSALAS